MRTSKLSFFVLLLATSLSAQNWSVFNPAYRYNYKFGNSILVSNVLFADSLKTQGVDTTFYLNRIGFECKGSCPGTTVSINPTVTVVVPNMPQFLQRSIVKYANGTTMLRDTAKLVIKPHCQVGQNWLFDSINNVTATCIAKLLQQTFGVADSVKHIVIGATDTLKLSKKFGILQFPQLYSKNNYYRLVGIEDANRYDSTALFGEKVPNAWDFYNFDPGDKFCITSSFYYKNYSGCTEANLTIHKKQIVSDAYNYDAYYIRTPTCYPRYYTSENKSTGYSSNAYSVSQLSGKRTENTMYPGQVLAQGFLFPDPKGPFFNLVKFAVDNKGTFYKYCGKSTCLKASNLGGPFDSLATYPGLIVPPTGTTTLYYSTVNLWSRWMLNELTAIYGVGLGEVARGRDWGLYSDGNSNCLTCAIKKGQLYFGNETFVGVTERNTSNSAAHFFPNPCHNSVRINLPTASDYEIKISDLLGKPVIQELTHNVDRIELNTSELSNGIYIVSVYANGQLLAKEKLIRE